MVAILGVASRTQVSGVEEIYETYLERLKGAYDIDMGIISEMDILEHNLDEISKHSLVIVVVLTGGTRKYILRIAYATRYIVMITHTYQNSLASGLHAAYIISKTKRRNLLHIHAPPERFSEYDKDLILALRNIAEYYGKEVLLLGVDKVFLFYEEYNTSRLSQILGIKVKTIPLERFIELYNNETEGEYFPMLKSLEGGLSNEVIGKITRLYTLTRKLMRGYVGGGIRCFPLIVSLGITPCTIVANLIDSGIPVACEADLPSLITMLLIQAITNQKSFIANVEDFDGKNIVIAHCTVAPSLTSDYRFIEHFETKLPIAIEGKLFMREVTLVKLSPDFTEIFIAEGKITRSGRFSDKFCRTQAIIETKADFSKFLSGAYAHHIVMTYGKHAEKIGRITKALGLRVVYV